MATERWIFGLLYLVAFVQTEEFEEAPDLPADDGLLMIVFFMNNNCVIIYTVVISYRFDSATKIIFIKRRLL